MSGDAIDHHRDALEKGRAWDDSRRETETMSVQLMAMGLSLQAMGLIPQHTDPEWLLTSIEQVDEESLR